MSNSIQLPYNVFLTLLLLTNLVGQSHGDVGTGAQYSPPYLPTACGGHDATQFPSNELFATAGEGIWDNGAACGRQYKVRCITADEPGTCIDPQKIIQIKIVDRAFTSVSRPTMSDATMVFSNTAFAAIANPSAKSMNIEFQQV